MKIGVIGLGGIFKKAYLSILSKNRQDCEFYFTSENKDTINMLKHQYGFHHVCHSLDELLALDIDACMIHSATVAHYDVAKKCLEAGVHVFMDKPLSETIDETRELLALAEQQGVVLMTGFNRRFAPGVMDIKELPGKRIIYLEKNRAFAEFSPTFAINDMFLHLVDTAVYLLDSSNIKVVSSKLVGEDILEYATLQLEADGVTAIISMDMKSGAHTELFRATSKSGVVTMNNLSDITYETPKETNYVKVPDWTPTLVKRGFDDMVNAFLHFVRTDDASGLRQEHVLLSHELCHIMLNRN